MLYTAFIFGLLGSFHCVGMCGPIAFMLPIDRTSRWKSIFQTFTYHFGRITSYALIGAIFGLLGKGFYFFGIQQQISIGVGVLMILSVVLPKLFKSVPVAKPILKFTNIIKNSLGSSLKKKETSTFYTIGFLNGLLPCGLVYMALFGALTSSTFYEGALYMALFGAGTIPLMSAIVLLGNVSSVINRRKIQKVIPFVVVLIGCVFVMRGLGLGIPFISPKPIISVVDAAGCH